MKPSKRILILAIVFQVLLLAFGGYLLMQLGNGQFTPRSSSEEVTQTITTVIGGAMGGLGGLFLAIYIVLKRRGS